jgi:hypothetical protein
MFPLDFRQKDLDILPFYRIGDERTEDRRNLRREDDALVHVASRLSDRVRQQLLRDVVLSTLRVVVRGGSGPSRRLCNAA